MKNRIRDCKTVTILLLLSLVATTAFSAPVAISENSVAKTFVADFIKADYAGMQPMLNSKMQQAFTSTLSQNALQAISAKYGSLQNQGSPIPGKIAGYNVVYIPCRFQHGSLNAKVVFDSSQKVTGFFFVTPGEK